MMDSLESAEGSTPDLPSSSELPVMDTTADDTNRHKDFNVKPEHTDSDPLGIESTDVHPNDVGRDPVRSVTASSDPELGAHGGDDTGSLEGNERETLVGSSMKAPDPNRKSSEESLDNFDNTMTTSLLDVQGPLSPDTPFDSHRHKYRPAMKMFLPFRLNKPSKDKMPLPYAGLFSVMTFHWMSSYMWGIYRKGIDKMPTWSCPPEESCAVNVARFEKGWKRELEERGEEMSSLPRVIRKLFAKRLMVSFVVLISTMILSFIGPAFVLRWLLEYLARPNVSIGYGIALVIGLCISEFSRSVFMAVWWFINYQMAIRARSGILSLLFRKLMRLQRLKDTNIGELINICTNDGQRIFDGVCLVPFLPSVAIVILFGIIYTSILVGPWSLLGMVTFFFFLRATIGMSRLTTKYRQGTITITDKRVRLMSELLNCIKLIKMYAWERAFSKHIQDARVAERKLLEKAAFTQSIAVSSSPFIPIVWAAVTFIGHTMTGNDLTAAQAFTMLSVLNALRFSVGIMPYCIKAFAEVIVSFRRIKKILLMDEMMMEQVLVTDDKHAVEMREYSGSWDDESTTDDKTTGDEGENNDLNKPATKKAKKSKKAKKATNGGHGDAVAAGDETALLNGQVKESVDVQTTGLLDINLVIPKGQLLGVCGCIGSGKSSLLSAIMGKMMKRSGTVAVNGSVAYAAQQAWIMNTTLRDNILFGRPYNHQKYQAALDASCLQPDLKDFVAGDMTEIGERGLTLSGGQKQRVSLARAVYSECDVVLLDDPLSAVDVHVGRHIFSECVKKALAGKTVIFVTHQLQYLKHCDHVIVLKDGRISESGTHTQLMGEGGEYSTLVHLYHTQHAMVESLPLISQATPDDAYLTLEQQLTVSSAENAKKDDQKGDGKLIEAEETSDGEVLWGTYWTYMRAAGGPIILLVLFVVFAAAIGVQGFTTWFLAYWLNQGSANTTVLSGNQSYVSNSIADNPELNFYTTIFGSLILIIMASSIVRGIFFMKLTLRASTNLHDRVLKTILRSPMSFFDTTPTGRILNRFSKDMDEIDVFLPFRLETFIQNIFLIISSLLIIAIISYWFVIALVPLTILFLLLNHLFMKSVRAIKCKDNTTRSPYISHIGASIHGISTIQAYGKTNDFIRKFDELLDANSVPFLLFNLASRWLAVRLDIICVILTAVTGILTVVTHEYITPAMAGLSLAFAINMTGMFQYTIRMAVETEARFTSVERIQKYIQNVTSEAATEVADDKKPDASWPIAGGIEFRNYSMKYRPNLPTVLRGVDLQIRPSEKIGIVGRTGSGKSSLGVALFRIVEAHTGSISIDGVNIADIGLNDLRSRLSIITQDPMLFIGTVRYNLDPFGQHSDNAIWTSLERCHIKDKIMSLPQQLETDVEENGDNFSVGECQLLCMARALLRKTKVIMLDEATAAIDTETDSLVQATLKEAFSDCTILTIAHRLNTVLSCDRIIVLDNGKVIEFDTPSALKNNSHSAFRKMLDVAETRDVMLE